jgi:V/A-type H+-transporting ATPase subunit K
MARIRIGIKIAAASLIVTLWALLVPFVLLAQQAGGRSSAVAPEVMKWGLMAAAVSVGASTIAGGIAVGMVGAAAMGVVGERPEVTPRALIFVGLAEGIAIYGLIVSVMILGKIS